MNVHWLPPGDVTPFVRQHRLVRVSDRHLVVDIDECKVCGKSFARNAHLISHSSVKPYECKVCATSFAYRHTLKIHYRPIVAI